jgi:hypothetical protein
MLEVLGIILAAVVVANLPAMLAELLEARHVGHKLAAVIIRCERGVDRFAACQGLNARELRFLLALAVAPFLVPERAHALAADTLAVVAVAPATPPVWLAPALILALVAAFPVALWLALQGEERVLDDQDKAWSVGNSPTLPLGPGASMRVERNRVTFGGKSYDGAWQAPQTPSAMVATGRDASGRALHPFEVARLRREHANEIHNSVTAAEMRDPEERKRADWTTDKLVGDAAMPWNRGHTIAPDVDRALVRTLETALPDGEYAA